MKKRLVLVGGGHAHLTALTRVADYVGRGHEVVLVNPDPYHYYSGMGPGMLGGTYRPQDIRFHVKKMVEDRGGVFVAGAVARLDPARRLLILEDEREVPYDVVSFNTGSHVPVAGLAPELPPRVIPVKPIIGLFHAREHLLELAARRAPALVVAGGGPAGVEIAGNLWRLLRTRGREGRITLVAGSRLLPRFPPRARRLALRSLTRRGVEVVEGDRLDRLGPEAIGTAQGRRLPYDMAFLALGVHPSAIFAASGLPFGEGGGLLVNEFLQAVRHPEIFGGGDCISFAPRALDKVGVYAVRANPVLAANLLAALEDRPLTPFDPGGAYLLIFNLGDGAGLFVKRSWVVHGRLAFWLKNYIDTRFMRTYQLSGERDDPAPAAPPV